MAKAESPSYSFGVVCCGYTVSVVAVVIAFFWLFTPNAKELAVVACFCGAALCQLIAVDLMGHYDLDLLTRLLAKFPAFNLLMYVAAWGYIDSWFSWIVMGVWTGFIVGGVCVMLF